MSKLIDIIKYEFGRIFTQKAAFSILIVALIFLPNGILGRVEVEKV